MSEARELPRAGLWRRLRYTPVSDALRGQLSGRLDVEWVLARAALPATSAGLVRQVVKRTRLWRSEKRHVATELAAHFRDGLDAGAAEDELIAGFGDAKQAARLIRRAKLRSRPWAWHVLRAVRWTVTAFLTLYVLLAGYLLLGRPNIATNYLVKLNAEAASVAEADRAWPLYRQALLNLDLQERPTGYRSYAQELLKDAPSPGSERWSEAVAWLHEHPAGVELIRQGAAKPGLGYLAGGGVAAEDHELFSHLAVVNDPYADTNSPLVSALLPHLTSLRMLMRVMLLDTFAAAGEGDTARLLRDAATVRGLARHAGETPTLINALVGISIDAALADSVAQIVAMHQDRLDQVALRELAHQLASVEMREPIERGWRGQRWMFRDILQRVYTDDGRDDGRLTTAGMHYMAQWSDRYKWMGPDAWGLEPPIQRLAMAGVLPAAVGATASRREMAARHDQLVDRQLAQLHSPLWREVESDADREIADWSEATRMRYFLIMQLMPAVGRHTVARGQARRDGALLGIALTVYHRQHGAWPASLAELVPQYMPALPVDPITGDALRYRVTDAGPIVYSVGADRDDDGGRPPAKGLLVQQWVDPAQLAAGTVQVPDGDWLLWPPQE